MSDTVPTLTEGAISASHEEIVTLPLRVAPATAGQKNRIFTGLMPIACFRVEDLRFEFGQSFVRPGLKDEIEQLKALRDAHKIQVIPTGSNQPATVFPSLSIFGHADPVGEADFNKRLSGRRAQAIYALLTRKTALWEDLHSNPLGSDGWGRGATDTMLASLGFTGNGALRAYQSARGLPLTGEADAPTRTRLYADYMDFLCGPEFVLDPTDDFLAHAADAQGKGDYQGCSHFNPVRIFSASEKQQFELLENHAARDAANAPNRRVVVLLYQPGSSVDPAKWPCPRATSGVEACRKRFWSDADARSRNTAERREFKETEDTFSCRFYQRMTGDSPCERRKALGETLFQLQLRNHKLEPLANAPYTLTVNGETTQDSTDGAGFINFTQASDAKGKLEIKGRHYEISFDDAMPADVRHTQALLNALGFNAGPLDGKLGRRTEDALKSFQRTHKLPPTGQIDEATSKALRKQQIIRSLDPPDETTNNSNGTNGSGPAGRKQRRALVKAPVSPPAPAPPVNPPSPPAPPPPAPGPPAPGPPVATPPPTPTVVLTDAVSRVDLPPPHDRLSQAIVRRFKDLDKDKDGFASKKEIDAAMKDSSYAGDDGAMVATLEKVFSDFEDFSNDEWGPENDGITLADVTAYDRLREKVNALPADQRKTSKDAATIDKVIAMFQFALDKIGKKAPTLFVGDPDVLAVEQGMIGDCWFLAALVAVGLRNKADIVAMVKPDGAQFEVTLPGLKGSIKTDPPTDAEIAIGASVGANGLWLSVIEKAIGLEMDLEGNFLGKGIQMTTGHSSTGNQIILSRESVLRKQLTDAFANKKIVTASIRGNMPFTDERRSDGLPMGHAYTIVSFDDAKSTIKVRNPWGNTGPTGTPEVHGVFEMDFKKFMSDFSRITNED